MNFLTEIREGFGISWAAIRANKLRSILTTLGIVIGIVTVTLMGTAIEGLNQSFLKSISSLGADVFYVDRGGSFQNEAAWRRAQKRQPFKPLSIFAAPKQKMCFWGDKMSVFFHWQAI